MAPSTDCLAVKIALLGLVNDLPEQPSTSASSKYIETQESQSGRTLTFKHEIVITQQLAFICAYSNDPLHVLATCVEEVIPRRSLIIRFAVNTGKHEVLVDGLKVISQILQNEAVNGSIPFQPDIPNYQRANYSQPLYEP